MSGVREDGGRGDWVLSRRSLLGGGLVGAVGVLAGGCASSDGNTAQGSPGGPGRPAGLTVDGLDEPIGLDPSDVFFAWRVSDPRRGASQSAYRIEVEGPEMGRAPAPTIWDSGRLSSAEQAFVSYGGPPLAADTAYRWTVQTWDAGGSPGAPSAPAVFETGLRSHDWSAHWIRRPADPQTEPDQYTYARTEFTLPPGRIVRARAYVSGDQQYELYLNGIRAGKGQAYSYPDTTYYETLDVTALLHSGGSNAAGVVTNWQGATKGHPAGEPGLIAQLAIHYEDGRRLTVGSDGSWRVRKGAWLAGSQRDLEGDQVDYTEQIDGPGQPAGWLLPGFDDSSWARATVLGRGPSAPWTRLISVRTRIVEAPVHPVSLTVLSSGSVVADFGAVVAAVPTVRFHHGTPGRTVQMRAGYLLDEPVAGEPFDGVPGQVSTVHGTQHTDMGYSYVQRGGTEEFHPFDYLGFRYFQIDQPGEPLGPDDVVALARHTALPARPAATFSSDQPVVDAIFGLGMHSAVFTAQEQFIDTPTREKGPWLFDGFNESCTAMAAVGEQNLTRKSLLEFAESQARYWPNGALNKIYPTGIGALDINEFTEIYPEWVWQYWLHTGDTALLAAVYGVLARISDYVQHSVSKRTGLVTSLPSTNVYYDIPVVTRLNVLGVNVFRRVADVAGVLRRPAVEVARHRDRQTLLTAAVNRQLTGPDGIYVDGLDEAGTPSSSSQTANACAAHYGVVPSVRLAAVAEHVWGLGMEAPPQTAAEVLRTLDLAGRHADLVTRLTDATIDGWANILARGATFTWEVWNPSDPNGDSMSHGWGSNVLVEIERSLLGVRPTGPGFATFAVTPPRGGLAWAQGSVPTPRGTVSVAWSRSSGATAGFALELGVPPNTVAQVTVPGTRESDLTESGRPIGGAAGVRWVGATAGLAQLEIGSGSYRIVSRSAG